MVSTTTVSVSVGMAGFALQQEVRDDADGPAAGVEGGIGDQPHQADAAAAIDQRYALARPAAAQADGGVAGGGIGPETGAAEDAEGGGGETSGTETLLFC